MTRTARRLLVALAIAGGALVAIALFAPVSPGSALSRPRVEAPPGPAEVGEPAVEYSSGERVTVPMKDNDYVPQTLTVDHGTVVIWENEGRSNHNVIPDKRSTGWKSKTIKPGRSFAQELEKPGAIGYFCTFHGSPGKGMYGTLIVKNADGTVPPVKLDRSERPGATGKARTIRVPKDARRIQTAVDKAPPGSLILVSPGVYREAVTVTTDRLVIRGLNRNKVILDGGFELDMGIKVLEADAVAVENMTARNFTENGFFWTGATGYRGSYLTSTRTGDYGIFAFNSTYGIFEHSYAAGSPDAGFYIGQCYPCDSIITDVIAEYNGLGYSGTNAGGNLIVKDSVWRYNRAGIVPNSGDGELNPPQHDSIVVGNVVYDNNNGRTPAIDAAILAQGNGILVAGGEDNVVIHNRVHNHDIAGIGLVPNPDRTLWFANRNRVIENVVSDSNEADLAWSLGEGNCFADNRFETSKPSDIEAVLPCTGTGIPAADQLDLQKYIDAQKPASVNYRTAKTPKPPKLPGMKNPKRAKARPAVGIVVDVDVESIRTPKLPRAARR